jgi:RimJ/RimL family protein N-acetyltransferase
MTSIGKDKTMSIDTQLFVGKLIRLGPIDHDKDPEVESRWTNDLSLLRAISRQPAMPLSVAQMKKKYEAIEKEVDESKRLFHFTIRGKEDGRLLGFVRIEGIEWTHGIASLKMVIGDPAERGKGYGSEVMQLILHFCFNELNLYRLSAVVVEDNPGALKFFQKFGFVEEVRRRKAILRDGQTWDSIHLGLLRDEWLATIGETRHE